MNIIPVLTRCILFIPVLVMIVLLQCSLLEVDHEFSINRRHSYDFGTSTMDSLAVFKIFKVNNIPYEKFSKIVVVGDNWRVQSLDLSGYGIDSLPDEIGCLGALERLNLSNNNLHSLPDSIIKLKVFFPYEYASGGGAPSSHPIRYYTEMLNGLGISGNALCNVSSEISNWIDTQFKTKNYLLSDKTQRCQ